MNEKSARDIVERLLPDYVIRGRAVALSGGLMNYVWRVPASPRDIVVKHAPPFIASAPDVPLDDRRILIEARCLELVGPGGRLHAISTDAVRPPVLLAYDFDSHAIVMEYLGQLPSLDMWLREGREDEETGRRLGRFVGALHRASARNGSMAASFSNLPIQETRLAVQYQAIRDLCAKAGLESSDEIGRKAVALGERLLRPGQCLIMGDLWPASILVGRGFLRVIDWEFAHYGNPAQDAAHLAAHMWMLAHRVPRTRRRVAKFWRQFVSSYLEALEEQREKLWTRQVSEDAGLHFGCEILVRTVGAFQSGYLYDGLDATDSSVQEAIRMAELFLLETDRWASFSIDFPKESSDIDAPEQ